MGLTSSSCSPALAAGQETEADEEKTPSFNQEAR
jgi:hypothetical protein